MELDFPASWQISKYDEWPFYRNGFQLCFDPKAMDFLALSPDRTLWLIELKDYRQRPRLKTIPLWEEVAIKARDTLAGILAAKMNAHHAQTALAKECVAAKSVRVVLHLEQTKAPSKTFPLVADRANVQQKLKQKVKAIDAHPLVIETANMSGVPWKATPI